MYSKLAYTDSPPKSQILKGSSNLPLGTLYWFALFVWLSAAATLGSAGASAIAAPTAQIAAAAVAPAGVGTGATAAPEQASAAAPEALPSLPQKRKW